jgi:hypothetical protein
MDPAERASSPRTPNGVRSQFDLSKTKSAFSGLPSHHCRHHAITRLAESQASDQAIMAIAGYASQEVLPHYAHVRLQAKRRAVETLVGEIWSEPQGWDSIKEDTLY